MFYNIKLIRQVYMLLTYIMWKLLGLRTAGLVKIQPRVIIISPRKVSIGKNCTLFSSCILKVVTGLVKQKGSSRLNTGKISIGNDTSIGEFTILNSMDSISIGSNVLIAPHCYIGDNNHIINDINVDIKKQGLIVEPVVIEDNVWIGEHVSVMSGVTIGKGSVVAFSAVITKNVAPYSVVAGVPAKVIKYRSRD